MAKTFVTSNLQLGRPGAIKKYNRSYENVDQMTDDLIAKWNTIITKHDTVYHLGDVLFGHDKEKWLAENFTKLNGKKHLVLGNHDNPKFLAPYFKSIKLWTELPGMVLSHAPLHEQTLNESHRFKDNILNVHGHIHTNACPPGPYKCVSVEQINYTPLNIEDIDIGQ